jgi:hypothetical protein
MNFYKLNKKYKFLRLSHLMKNADTQYTTRIL